MIEHRQSFFLQIQTIVGNLQLTVQAIVLFLKLLDAPLLWRF